MKDEYTCEVCCVGLGPAGMGAAYALSHSPIADHTLCLDAGASAGSKDCQILNGGSCDFENPCQMISGVGGASIISGGKISMLPAGSGLVSILGSQSYAEKELQRAFETLRRYLPLREVNTKCEPLVAEKQFKKLGFEYRYYPVYIFNRCQLVEAFERFLLEVKSSGTQVLLNTKVTKIELENGRFSLVAKQDKDEISISAKHLILAVGRLGQDLLSSLCTESNMVSTKYHLDVGVRLEFPTEIYPDLDESHGDLKLLFDDARTFCVCRDGKIAPYKYEDIFLVEGASDSKIQTGFTNLSIVVRLKPSKQNKLVFEETKKRVLEISGGIPVRQMLPEFLGMKRRVHYPTSSITFWKWGNVNRCFPQKISSKIRDAVGHFACSLLPEDQLQEVSVFAPEVDCRLSFPIESDFSLISSLFLVGDCTGKFRGILQSFCSGLSCAEGIIRSSEHGEEQRQR